MTFVTFFRSLFVGAALIAASPAVVAGQKADIIDTAKSAGNFTTLVAAIEAAGLTDTLKGKGPFTVFAPTDEAFAKTAGRHRRGAAQGPGEARQDPDLPRGGGRSDRQTGQARQGDHRRRQHAQRDSRQPGREGGQPNVVALDVMATNGVIHVIDSVVMPN
jgi:hypothetical protein